MHRFLLASLALVPGVCWAQSAPGIADLMHARNFAMGGAYRALGPGGESLGGNPAAMLLQKVYVMELTGAWDSENKFGFASASIVDSQTTQVAAGLSYHFVSLGRGEDRRSAHLTSLGVAIPLSDNLYAGATVRYLLIADTANAITMDAGLLLRLSDALRVSASGHNLIDIRHPEMSRYFAVGLAYSAGALTATADVRVDFSSKPSTQAAYSGGLEYVVAGAFPLRAGYSYDNIAGTQFVSGGVGILGGAGGGLDFGYRHEIGGNDGRLFAMTLRF